MKAGKYSVKELFVNRHVQQIVIPEIQRDYVWKSEQVLGLLNSIKVDYDKFKTVSIPRVDTSDKELQNAFEVFYKRRNNGSNIGFIYAYNDDQFSGKYFLIDGQQRITTIFLMLLVLACKNEHNKEVFKKTYFSDAILKIDYKVRESAHNFLKEFVSEALKGNSDFTNQSWYYSNKYDSDKTIKSLLANYNVIEKYIEDNLRDDTKSFYNYIENYVEFWYFDTNISEQGEELYIYMNARGEQMQSNENIKADLLSKLDGLDKKNEYGEKWEHWQDFFWIHRGSNENADKGFNQFLTCIAGLENYLRGKTDVFYTKQEFDGEGDSPLSKGIRTQDVLKVLDVNLIEKYIKAFKFLVQECEAFSASRSYTDWVNNALSDFCDIFNSKNPTNWFADYSDRNRNTERNNMVFVWSMLYYIKESLGDNVENKYNSDTIRFFRRMYLRFKNYNRSVTTLKSHVDITLINGVLDETDNAVSEIIATDQNDQLEDGERDSTVLTEDEIFKNKVLLSFTNREEVKTIEELIWQIEDHEYNLNGRDVGNTNLTHLLNRPSQDVSIEYLELIKTKFNEIFPPKEDKELQIKVIEVLLTYGEFYDKVSPYYYLNFKFNSWRRIIRNISTELRVHNYKPFSSFFTEFVSYHGSFIEFHKEKTSQNITPENAKTVRERLIYYSRNLGLEMWNQGFYIAISLGNPCSLEHWEKRDLIFTDVHRYYNTKGNLRGGTPQTLSKLITTKHYA